MGQRTGCSRYAVLFGVILAATAPSSGTTGGEAKEVVAGYIEDCAGNCSDYFINTEEQRAQLLMPVWKGDKIIVPAPAGWMKLRFGTNQRITIEYADSPYTVPKPQEGPGYWSNLVSHLSGKIVKAFTSFATRHDVREATSLTTRGSEDEDGLPLTAGILRHDNMQIASGTRQFSLSWQGGTRPFSIRIFKDGELKPVLARDGLDDRSLSVAGVAFPRGSYKVEVKDRLQRQTAGFIAVDQARVPSPSSSEVNALPPEVARTLVATWRAAQDDGVWALESFLEAAELAETFPPARTLRDGLAAGDLPDL